jgi:hypothetical protein
MGEGYACMGDKIEASTLERDQILTNSLHKCFEEFSSMI